MERDLLRIRLEAARRADRVIDRTRSVDARDPAGRKVTTWIQEHEKMVEALREKVESYELALLAESQDNMSA